MSAADAAVQPSNDDGALRAAAADDPLRRVDEFLIARGGPFYALQQRLGLLHERALHAGRRAALLVGLAWGVPLLLSAVAGHAIGPFQAARSCSISAPGRASSSRSGSSS
jgi:hypothetical protein